jgi:hypothetical protein
VEEAHAEEGDPPGPWGRDSPPIATSRDRTTALSSVSRQPR